MNTLTKKLLTAGLALGIAVTGVACGSGSSDTATDTSSSAGAAAPGAVLDANTASEDELKAAFEAAGLPNAETWAHEIIEYRPFESMDDMHEELKEYDISDDTWNELSALVELS